MHNDISRIVFTEDEIKKRVCELGAEISKKYNDVFIVTILKGSFIFTSDLVRAISCRTYIDFMAVSSYGYSSKSSGAVRILKDLDSDITEKKILIVEDIIDTGQTVNYIRELLFARGAESIEVCSLLDKPGQRLRAINVEYRGFVAQNEFLVGYGLDYAEKYRNLPFIGALKKEAIDG